MSRLAAHWARPRCPAIAPDRVPNRPAASRFNLIGFPSIAPSRANNAAVLMLF